MPKRIFLFSDIDDTLIQTKRKTDFSKKTIVAGYTKEGKENSFFYEGTKLLIDTLIKSGITIIPTTARNLTSYKRTIFYNQIHKYSILNFGGTILNKNIIDKEWEEKIFIQLNNTTSISDIFNLIQIIFKNIKISIKIIDNFYISIYNKYFLDNKEILDNIRNKLSSFLEKEKDFYLYENQNSFGILPRCLNKKFAVNFIIEKENPILTIGAGDNISDLMFMKDKDFLLIPKNYFKITPL